MKNKIIVFSFLGYIFLFSLAHIFLPDKLISETERRKLKEFPKFEFSSSYVTELDEYLLDHFPLRDEFRSIKAKYNFYLLNHLDNNGIYLSGDYIFKTEYPTNHQSIDKFLNNTNKLLGLLNENNNVYMVIVPDKNYYLKDENFLHLDYDYIYDKVNSIDVNHIDIRDILELEDYYETDTHWKQEHILKVVKKLSETMNFEYQDFEYQYNTYDNFYGVYYGESALNRKPEKITYLTNDIISDSKVVYLENSNLTTVYNEENLESLDAYEVYLDGASAFIEIYNEHNTSGKELIIFRDSFGSSITPLLIPYYSKITVIDNRYMMSDYIKEYVEFDDQDVLFLYSTLIVNNSGSLKG